MTVEYTRVTLLHQIIFNLILGQLDARFDHTEQAEVFREQ